MAYSPAAQLRITKVATSYTGAVAITPTDGEQIGPFQALYVGGAGSVALAPVNDAAAVVFAAVPAGTILPVTFQGVDATGTTATGLVGLG